ncbi:MAG: filamentous hemagglutinin N-terminal domain-containing protein, partial [Rivularia sp. (in: cyanobacteria)]
MFHRYSVLFGLSLTLSLPAAFPVNAQLTPDNTLGKENSIVNPSKLLQRIDGGAIRGSNLFHSFKEFNIDSGKSVYFSNPTAIENILTRVTGKNPSNIFGKLGVLGNANLFLLNPNGIIFGKGASLDISGSFSATTSPSILFDNGFEFSATNPQTVPLLKVNITPGLQYPRSQQGDITNKGNLIVGEDLNLIGKNIYLTGELNSGSDLNIIATDSIEINNTNLKANNEDFENAGFIDISSNKLTISDNSQIIVSSKGTGDGGYILITASDVNLNNQSKISATTENGSNAYIEFKNLNSLQLNNYSEISASTVDGEAGFITINASDEIKIAGNSKLESAATGNGEAGFLNIKTNNLSLSDNSTMNANSGVGQKLGYISIEANKIHLDNYSEISASTVDGEAGFITLKASDEIEIEADSKIASGAVGVGIAGFLEIITDKLTINDNSKATVSSKGSGDAGYVEIEASNVNINNRAKISATTEAGIGGYISLNGLNSLILSNNSEISASTVDGEAGDITMNASDSVKIESNSRLESAAIGKGEAGFIDITTNKLSVSDNSQANVSSKDSQNPGYILIKALDVNLTNQAEISATTVSGISGDITLEDLNSLTLNNSKISASTVNGIAGNLNISAAELIELTGKGGLSVQSTEGGIAGSVTVETSRLDIKDEARITVSSKLGQAGNLDITAENIFINQGTLTAETGIGDGSEGANIMLYIQDLLQMRNNSLISAAAFDTANGGNITINNSQGFVIGLPFENSDIIANADKGNGGDIDITTQNIFGLVFREQNTSKSDITASSKFGLNGQVTVDQLNVNPASGLIELPSTLVGTTGIKAGCAASEGNNFVV